MTWELLLLACIAVSRASADGCCRNYKLVQIRRPNMFPMFDSQPPCESMYEEPEYPEPPPSPSTSQPLEAMFHQAEQIAKSIEPPGQYSGPHMNRFMPPPFMDSKNMMPHKCSCSKQSPPQRMMPSVPRYYKRRYCNEPMFEPRPPPGYRPCSCGQCYYGQCPCGPGPCGQYPCGPCPCGPCSCGPCPCGGCSCGQCPCSRFDDCPGQFPMPPVVFHPPPHPVLPLPLPPSCIC